jgi:hypothetical protein
MKKYILNQPSTYTIRVMEKHFLRVTTKSIPRIDNNEVDDLANQQDRSYQSH